MNQRSSERYPICAGAPGGWDRHGWCWSKLSDLARLESGHTPSRSRPDWWGGDISWLSLTEIRALDGQWVNETRLRTSEAGIANSSARILPRSTVCLSRTASVGFVAILGRPMATSQDFANWVCGAELDPEFLMFALIRSRAYLRSIGSGATHKTIYMPTLSAFHVIHPALDEQKRIVGQLKARLVEVLSSTRASEKQIDELDLLNQKLIARAASGLNSSPVGRLADVVHAIQSGRSAQTTELPAREDQLGILKVSAVSWGSFRPCEAKVVERGYQPEDHHRVRKGDVLISRANTVELVGAVVRADRDYPNRLLSDKTLRLILAENRCDPEYIVQVLRFPEARAHIEANATGTSNSMRNISQDTIRATPIRLPSLPAQRRFVTKLNTVAVEITKLTAALQKQLEELKSMRQKLLAQVFES